MSIYSLFNIRATAPSASGGRAMPELAGSDGTTSPSEPIGQFITPQSLTSFAGATGAISLIWAFVSGIVPQIAQSPWMSNVVGFLISALIGTMIYWINTSDPAAPAMSTRDRQIAVVIAALNTLVLYSASFGAHRLITSGT
jgi:hypothetical protein